MFRLIGLLEHWPSKGAAAGVLALVCSLGGSSARAAGADEEAAASRVSIAVLPIEFGSPSLSAHAEELQAALLESVEFLLYQDAAPKPHVAAALAAIGSQNFAESWKALGRVADAAGATYAIHVVLYVDEAEGTIVAKGLCASNGGVLRAQAVLKSRWARAERPMEVAKRLLVQLVGRLGLSGLGLP